MARAEESISGYKDASGLRRLIDAGAEIAGGATGGILGFLAGGPAGAALFGASGAVAAMALRHIGNEASERLLGPREQARLGGVLALAAEEIRDRANGGESVRSDGFFDQKENGRSDAEEFAESVLLKSQREPEERKLPFMAHLLANVAFDNEISADLAHQLTKTAEALTYRQLCLLKLSVFKEGLREHDYRGQRVGREKYQLLHECLDLYNRGLVNFGGQAALGLTDVIPGKMMAQGIGADLFNQMRLGSIPEDHVAPIAALLR